MSSDETPFEPEPGLHFLDMRGGMQKDPVTGKWAATSGREHEVLSVPSKGVKPGTWTVVDLGGAAFLIKRLPSGQWVEA